MTFLSAGVPDVWSPDQYRSVRVEATSAPRRLGLRAEKSASGGCADDPRGGLGCSDVSEQSLGPPGGADGWSERRDLQLMPYPFSGRTIQPEEYRATIRVIR